MITKYVVMRINKKGHVLNTYFFNSYTEMEIDLELLYSDLKGEIYDLEYYGHYLSKDSTKFLLKKFNINPW